MDYKSLARDLRQYANQYTGTYSHDALLQKGADAIESLEADLAAAHQAANLWRERHERAEAELAAARADATLLRSTLIDIAAVMGMSSLPSYYEWEKIRNRALQLVAALAGEKK